MSGRRDHVWLVQRTDAVGGTKVIMERLASELVARGRRATVVFLRSHEAAIEARAHAGRALVSALSDSARLLARLARERPTTLVTFTPTLGPLSALAARALGCRRVVATHHTPIERLGFATRLLDRWAGSWGVYDAVVACSASVAAPLQRYPDRYRRRLTVIPNGVAASDAPRDTGPDRPPRRALGLPVGARVAFAAGRVVAAKNLELAIEALAPMPDWHLVVAGHGEHRPVLERHAEQLDCAGRVHFLGRVERAEVDAWLSACDAYLQPSRVEGLSLALLEAMARGAPCLAADIPANQEPLGTASDGAVGLLLPVDDPGAWREALRSLAADPERGARLGRAARHRQRERFEVRAAVQAYLAVVDGGASA